MANKKVWIPSTIAGICVLIIIIVMLSISIESVEENHIAILFDNWTQTIADTKIYDAGIYVIGPTKDLIQFPTTYVQLDLTGENSVLCRSKDGMLLTLQLHINYTYDRGALIDLYEHYTNNFEDFLDNITFNSIRDTISMYEARAFQENYTEIFDALSKNLTDDYHEIYINFASLDMTVPVLPTSYSQMLNEIMNIKQKLTNQDSTISQLEATLESNETLARKEADRQVTEKSSAINVQKTQKISEYEYECTMAKQESRSLYNLASTFKALKADDARSKTQAVESYINDLLSSNTGADVLVGDYRFVVA